ncbi:MAG: sigma-70 family RNA polymerase sigma factor [Symploca sp. SIO2D2]|nr:sigma-70 family RNA polymerase sigma factor [Symploca sp. SIO2D2]
MDCALTGQGNDLLISQFWEKWTEYQDQLYRCCLKFMNSNPTDAEDALSQAMLKAWEKVQKYAGKIDNLKAWLFKLTSNLCIDIIRKRDRGAVGVECIEWVGDTEEIGIGSTVASPESCLEREEKSTEIQQAIANLPETLRKTFILHFYQELTHTEIAQCQGISYENVCRRIYRARKQLKEKLSSYFKGAQEDVISSPVEHLDFGEKKAEGSTASRNRRLGRRLQGKEEGSQLDSHELSFTTKEFKVETPESVESSIAPRELAAPTVRETGTVSVGKYNRSCRTIKGEPLQQSPIYPFGLSGICLQQRFAIALSHISRLTRIVWGKLLFQYDLTLHVCTCSSG